MSEAQDISPLFQNDNDEDNAVTAELFRDRVRCLHEYFDKNGDGFLNFEELAALQKATEGATLTKEMYVMACKALDSKPDRGISVDALKLTYASEGTDISKFFLQLCRSMLQIQICLNVISTQIKIITKSFQKRNRKKSQKEKTMCMKLARMDLIFHSSVTI